MSFTRLSIVARIYLLPHIIQPNSHFKLATLHTTMRNNLESSLGTFAVSFLVRFLLCAKCTWAVNTSVSRTWLQTEHQVQEVVFLCSFVDSQQPPRVTRDPPATHNTSTLATYPTLPLAQQINTQEGRASQTHHTRPKPPSMDSLLAPVAAAYPESVGRKCLEGTANSWLRGWFLSWLACRMENTEFLFFSFLFALFQPPPLTSCVSRFTGWPSPLSKHNCCCVSLSFSLRDKLLRLKNVNN